MDAVALAPAGAVGKMQRRWGLGLIIVNTLVVLLAIVSVLENYLVHRDATILATQNTARLLSHDLQANFDKLDLALLTLKDEVERQSGAIDWAAVGATANKQFKRYPRLGFLGASDATGRVVAGAGESAVDLSHRDYFKNLQRDPNAGLVISEPLIAYNKEWSIVFARRVNQPSGEFAGVLYAIVALKTLQDLFASVEVGRDGAIVLRTLDQSMVARFPPPETIGIVPGDKSATQEWAEQLVKHPNNGFLAAAGSDQIARLLSYERIGSYPFFVFVGMSRDSAFSHWRLEALITALLSTIILFTSAFVALGLRRQDADSKRIFDLQGAALQSSQEQLRLAVDGAELGSWAFDIQQRQFTASDRAKAILGIPVDQPILDRECLNAIHPDDRDAVTSALQGAIEDGKKFDIRVRAVHPDRTLHWVHSMGLRVQEGAHGKVLGIIQDISAEINDLESIKEAKSRAEEALEARAKSENELRTLTHSLEQRVEDEVARRETAHQRLAHAQRLEAVGQLAGGVAHDFNNVIQVVQGCAEMIESEGESLDQARQLANVILEASSRGAMVTKRLLAFSRQSDLAAEPVDVIKLLESLRVILAHTLGTGIAIDVQVQPNLPCLKADKAQLETVLVNIAVNARDAMNETGTLRISAEVETIQDGDPRGQFIRLRSGVYLRITMSDNGPGMTPEVLARACEPFFTTKPIGKGTGLGLAMAKGFAEQSGGAFDIETELGHGTTVKLWFPADGLGAGDKSIPRDTTIKQATHGRANILIVDDDPLVLDTLARQMEARRYLVRRAESAKRALDQLDDEVALIVTDLSMPEMDGLTLIRNVHARRPGLPAILLTGFAAKALEIESSSVSCVLKKPVSANELAGEIERMLSGAS